MSLHPFENVAVGWCFNTPSEATPNTIGVDQNATPSRKVSGMASVYEYNTKNGKRWYVKWRDEDWMSHTKRGFTRKTDAKDFAARMSVSINDGDYIDPQSSKIAVSALARTYLEGKRHTVKPKYWHNLESSWRTRVKPKWGRRQVGGIRYSEIQAWVSEMSATVSATTARRAYDVLNGICKLAVKDRLIRANPCEGVKLPRRAAKARTYLTIDQLIALANASGEHRAVILVLGFCGLRFGELRALRVSDVDVPRSRLHVRHSVVRTTGGFVEGLPKTHERREVPVPPSVMNVLLGETIGKRPDDLLFSGNSHGYLGEVTKGGRNWYARALKASGVPELTVHDLRHTAASIAISSGANVKAVQRMLGHKTAAMTLDTYADLFDSDLDAVALDVERRIGEHVGGL